jgi:hypothetical protein
MLLVMLGDCFHGGDKYKKADIEAVTKDRCKPIHHIRLHGYLTCHSTPISDDGELEQGWFERLRRMYHESCECDESISEKKRKKVA